MGILKNKSGMSEDIFAVIGFLLAFGFISILAYYLQTRLIAAFQLIPVFNNTPTMGVVANQFTAAILLYDDVIVVVMVLMIIAIGLANYKLRTSAAFFVITIIEAVLCGFVSYFFNYIFIQLTTNSTLAATTSLFPKTFMILTNLHWLALVLFIVGSITLYAKKQTDEGYAQ
jgi:hypothetical protein